MRRVLLRGGFLVGTYVFPLAAVAIYLLAFVLLRDKCASSRETDAGNGLLTPDKTEDDENYRALLEQRLIQLEAEVTSADAELRRRFRDAGLA